MKKVVLLEPLGIPGSELVAMVKDAVGAAIFLLVLIGSVVWDVTPVLFVILAGITGVVCRVLLKKGASV